MSKMENKVIDSNNTSTIVIIAGLVIIFAGLFQAESIVNPVLMGLFLSIITAQPILWLENKKVPIGVAILIVLAVEVVVFFGLANIIGNSFSDFSSNTRVYEENLNQMWQSFMLYLNDKGIAFTGENLSTAFNPTKILGYTSGALNELGGVLGNSITIFFLSLFLILEMDSFSLKLKAIAQNTSFTLDFLTTIGNSIRKYLFIKTLTSLLTGFIIWICLKIVGVDYAIIWALIAFLLNYIPNIGSILAAFPAILFALIQLGLGGAIWTGVIFLAANMVIGNAVEPKMMGKGLGLSTYIVFVALLFWGFILGIVGMFLSVPLTMACKIVFEQNKKTKWMAVLLGNDEDAKRALNENAKNEE